MNLQKMSVEEICSNELATINGGSWIKKLTWGYIAQQIVDNWDDIKKGLSEGYHAGNQ